MNRRDALRNLALFTGGMILAPSCNFDQEDILQAYDNLKVTPSQSGLLASIADTIIPPTTDIKGAADIRVQDFILVMVNDCMKPEEQEMFMKGLSDFNSFSKNNAGKGFDNLAPAEREAVIIQGMALENEDQQHITKFLQTTKRFTIQGFMASEYMMTEVNPYSLIPGQYQGEVLIANLKPESQIHG
jgi:hypothetical protein